MKRLTFILLLLPLFGLSQGVADYDEMRARNYIIYDNDKNMTAASGDSILAFRNGTDTAYLIPYMSGATYWSKSSGHLYPTTLTDSVGIGTNSPSEIFDVSGNITVTGNIYPSADNTYTLGTSTYGWDTIFMSSVIEYGTSDLIFSSGVEDIRFTKDGNIGIGTNSPDSLLDVAGGANFDGDILVMGGWSSWTPTWVWTGGNIGTPTTVVAQYVITNKKVEFTIDAIGVNESGSGANAVNITLPVAPKDLNIYVPVTVLINTSDTNIPTTRAAGAVDAQTNLKLYINDIAIPNTNTFRLIISGFYQIS